MTKPSANALQGLDEIPWHDLQVAYGSAERVPEIIRRLAGETHVDVDRGWEEINEQILWHQGTVWPGTLAAVHFLLKISAAPHTLRRPRSYLAQLSLGGDAPYSPAGTASAVRTAIRKDLPLVHGFLHTDEPPLGVAVAELAAALPFDLQAARPTVDALFTAETESGARVALAGSRAMLGDWSAAVRDLLLAAEEHSIYRAVRLPGGGTMRPAGMLPDAQEFQGRPVENIVGLPVHSTVASWIAESAAGIEDDNFFHAARCVNSLFWEAGDVVWNGL